MYSSVDGTGAGRSPDDLLTDARFLVQADPAEVLALSGQVVSESARLAAMIYRASLGWHRDSDPRSRAQLLSLDAARRGATELAQRFAAVADPDTPGWQPDWATGSLLSDALLWSADTTEPANRLGHTKVYSVSSATVDGRPVVVAYRSDHTVLVWDLATGARIGTPDPDVPYRQLYTRVLDGQPYPIVGGTAVVGDVMASAVVFLDPVTGRHIGAPIATGHRIVDLVRTTLADDPIAVTAGADGTIRVWDLTDGDQIGQPMTSHTGRITALAAVEMDGQPVVVTSGSYDDKTIQTWDIASGRQVGQPFIPGNQVEALAATILDGRPVAVTAAPTDPTELWDLTTGTRIRQLLSRQESVAMGNQSIAVADVAGRPVLVAGGFDGAIRVVDLATGQQLGDPLPGHASSMGVNAVAVADLDGRPVAITGGWDSMVRVWDLTALSKDDAPVKRLSGYVSALAVTSVNDRAVVVTSNVGRRDIRLSVRALCDGQPVGEPLTVDTDRIQRLPMAVADLDGRPVAVTSCSNYWKVWDLANRTEIGQYNVPYHLDDHSGPATAIATGTWDGNPVVVTGHHHDNAHAWTLADGTHRVRVKGRNSEYATVAAAAVATLRGRPVAVTLGGEEPAVRVWWLTSGRRVCQPDTGHSGCLIAVATCELDGQPVAITGGRDQTARVWDISTGKPVREPLVGHSDSVTTVTTAVLDGRPVVITGSADRTVRLWELADGKQLDQMAFPDPVQALAVAPDGRLVVGFGRDIAVLAHPGFTGGVGLS